MNYLSPNFNKAAMAMSVSVQSPGDWKQKISESINLRNGLLNRAKEGSLKDISEAINELRQVECAPLLNGDISLTDYIIKNPGRVSGRVDNILVENCNVLKITPGEAFLAAEISYVENNEQKKYDYEIVYKNIDGKWYLSKFAYAE
ncbi:hypothetical protein [Oxobacter pfennigii]|uniref:hypothetical protein n=1 Tax=Oxobacter pfennigii TaxID=36849 RepID=UPI00128F86DD|nr:hypothetical protein [Oxobacter pfennigii]